MHIRTLLVLAFAVGLIAPNAAAQSDLTGTWAVDRTRSDDLEPWRNIELRIDATDELVTVARTLSAGRRNVRQDSIAVATDGSRTEHAMENSAKWLEQPHLGVFLEDSKQVLSATWLAPKRALEIMSTQTVQTSQAAIDVDIRSTYILSNDGTEMTVIVDRSSRPGQLTYVYTRQ